MALYYIDEDLTTGLSDGSSWINAFQTWAEMISGVGTLSENSIVNYRSTGVVNLARAMTGIDLSGFDLDLVFEAGAIMTHNAGYTPVLYTNLTGIGNLNIVNPYLRPGVNVYGIRTIASAHTVNIINPKIIGPVGISHRAIYATGSTITNVIHGVFVNCLYGVTNTSIGTLNAFNCYATGTTEAYSNTGGGALNLTTCASSDLTGSVGLQSISYDVTTFVGVSLGSEDFHLLLGSSLIGAGTTNSYLTDFDGDFWGTLRDIGIYAYTTALLEASLEDFVSGQTIFETITASNNYISSTFSYADIEDGFSGFFNFVDNPLERKFGKNSLWFGGITGTESSLDVTGSVSNNPFVIYVDGVQSTPTKAANRITLFTGLADTAHNVCIIAKTSTINLFNAIPTTGLITMQVTGASPVVLPLAMDYVSNPAFLGLNSYSTADRPLLDLTPTYKEVDPWSYEQGQIIFDSICDEIWVYTDSTSVVYCVDGGSLVQVDFTELNTESGLPVRRAVQVASGLDNTQNHTYSIWSRYSDTFGIQGVLCKNSGALANITTPTQSFKRTLIIGSSVVAGTVGTLQGFADSWIYSKNLNLLNIKAGLAGNTTAQTTADLPNIISASGIPEIVIFGASTNDNGDAGIGAKYTTLINAILASGVTTVICRGVLPYLSALNIALESAVTALANPNVYYVESQTWTPIDTIDGTHPTILGYTQLATFEEPEFQSIIIQAIPNNFTSGQAIFESITASAEIIAEFNNFISGQALFESITASNNIIQIDLEIIITTGIIEDKIITTGSI